MSQEQRIHAGAVELLSLPTSTTSTTTTTTTATSIAATASATAAATATAGRDGQSSRGGGKTCLSGGGGTDERAVAAVRLPWVQAAWKGGCHQVSPALSREHTGLSPVLGNADIEPCADAVAYAPALACVCQHMLCTPAAFFELAADCTATTAPLFVLFLRLDFQVAPA